MNISVIIPTYNREEKVKNAIESVLAQTVKPYEIIVVDDGSTDNTKNVIQKIKNITYIYQQNRGVSAARNKGIAHATGEYIALLDSDDLWKPEKLEKHIKYIKNNPKYNVSQTEEIWIRNGKFVNPMKKHLKPIGNIFIPSLELCLVSPSTVIIHKSIFEKYGTFDENLPACEDYDLWLRVSAFEPIGLLKEKLTVKYGGHVDQLSKAYYAMDRFRVYAIEKILQKNIKPEYKKAAISVLLKKCEILINGYKKRGNQKEALFYENILKKYQI
jgi:glycosyltransferase involved in cell wall biosynthesis